MATSSEENEDPHMQQVKEFIETNGVSNINVFLEKKLEEWKHEKITIAVTGDPGVGKSSFINAIRRLKDDGECDAAAKTGVVETTTKPMKYLHPLNNKIEFWDLPGIGTPDRPIPEDYFGEVKFKDYDAYLILARGRFTEYDKQLAKKVKSLNKPFFFIRTHIDEDLSNESEKKTYIEDETLKVIREDCLKHLNGLISSDEDVFLISNKKLNWDFDRLTQAISEVLPCRKKESLLLSLHVFTKDMVERKAEMLRGRIWKIAAASAFFSAQAPTGVSAVLDLVLIANEISFYKSQFGLPDEEASDDFQTISPATQGDIGKLLIARGAEITKQMATEDKEKDSRFSNILGKTVVGSIAFLSTYSILDNRLTELKIKALRTLASRSTSDRNALDMRDLDRELKI